MANYNRSGSNRSHNQEWDQNDNQGNRKGYGQRETDYNRINYMPDNDENRSYRDRDYENTQFGTSGTFGYRGGDYAQDYNPGGFSKFEDRSSFGNRDYDRNYRERDRGYGSLGTGNYDRRGERNVYADREGNERGRWNKTGGEVSSWPGDANAGHQRSTGRMNTAGNRGKGPKDYHRSEERIREDVCDRLTDDAIVDATGIQVQVQGDEVVLAGNVNNREEKRRAEDIVERVYGVRNVENRIRVGRGNEAEGNRTNR
jgi:osmotically-inducible protein OsmY